MHEEIKPNSFLALHPGSLAAGTRLSLRVWSWEERSCFFPVASVRNPSLLLLLSFWDSFSWICFELSPYPFLLLLLNGHLYWIPAVSQSPESWTKAPDLFWWGILAFPPLFLFIFYSSFPPGLMRREKIHFQEQQNADHKLFLLQSWQHRLGVPDSGWETSACWERPELSWKPSVAVPHLLC